MRPVGANAGILALQHGENHVRQRDRTGRTFSQECQRYLDVRRFHELLLVTEDVVHGSGVRGIQSRGLEHGKQDRDGQGQVSDPPGRGSRGTKGLTLKKVENLKVVP